MAFKKGHKKIGGRKKGAENKNTAEVKSMVLGALTDAGGQEYLLQQAIENPTAFLTLVGKIIPSEIKGLVEVIHQVKRINLSGDADRNNDPSTG